jgi:hypothetical protein
LEVASRWKGSWKKLSWELTRVAGSGGLGRTTGVAERIRIGDSTFDIEELFNRGAQGLLNAYFTTHPQTFSEATAFVVETRSLAQARLQGDAAGTFTVDAWSRTFTITPEYRWRRYFTPFGSSPGAALQKTGRFQVKATIQIWRRMELVPTFEHQLAEIVGEADHAFTVKRFELLMRVPFLWKWGHGTVLR